MSEASSAQDATALIQDMQQQLTLLRSRMEQVESRLGVRPSPWNPSSIPETPYRQAAPAAPSPRLTAPAPSLPRAEQRTENQSTPTVIPTQRTQAVSPPPLPTSAALPATDPATLPHAASAVNTRLGASSILEAVPTIAAPVAQVAPPQASRQPSVGSGTPAPTSPLFIADWENLIGGKWALWVGSLSLFLALASFLAYTWRSLPPPPPAARVAMGLAAGAVCLAIGFYARSRAQRWFSEGISGAGLGIVYLSIWAGAQYFHILPLSLAFVAMTLTTVLGGYLAVRYDALSLSIISTLGGFLTPLLLRDSASSTEAITLLTYVAILNGGLLALSLRKRWAGLTWLSLAATVLLLGAWYFDSYDEAHQWLAFVFVTIYFLEFIGAACFYSLAHKQQTAHSDLLLLFATTMTYAVAGYALVNTATNSLPATFPLGLVLCFLLVGNATRALAPQNLTLRHSTTGLALIFLTIAVPMQLKQHWLAVGWSVEAGTLLILGAHFRGPLLQRAGQLVWALSLLSLATTLAEAPATPHLLFLNAKALPLLASVLVMALVTIKLHQESRRQAGAPTPGNAPTVVFSDELSSWYAVYAVFAGAWLLAQETYRGCAWQLAGAANSKSAAFFLIACLLSGYALTLFFIGMKQRHTTVLVSALTVAVLAAALPLWAGVAMPSAEWTPFWNLRWLAYLLVTANLAAIGRLISRNEDMFEPASIEALGVLPGAIALFALAGLTTEVYFSFEHWKLPDPATWQTAVCFVLAMLWGGFAMALLNLAYRSQQRRLSALAYGVGSGAVGALLWASLNSNAFAWTPLLNLRWLAFMLIASLLFIAGQQVGKAHSSAKSAGTPEPQILATPLSAAFSLLSQILCLWGATQETCMACRHFHAALGPHWNLVAEFAITLLWCVFSTLLLATGLSFKRSLQRKFAYLVGGLASGLLLLASWQATRLGWMPILNLRYLTFLFVTVTLGISATVLGRRVKAGTIESADSAIIFPAGSIALGLLLWGLTQETYETCFYFQHGLGAHWDRWAAMFISLVWLLYGTGLLIGGIRRRYQPVRLASLTLLGATVLKVFLFDLSFLGNSLKMLSLAGLGIALIFISWLYSRYGAAQSAHNPGP